MTSAEELFCNGQIRPISLSAHLRRPPQTLSPLAESDVADERGTSVRGREAKPRAGSLHRRTRSMSPPRTANDDGEPIPDGDGAPPLPLPPGSRSSSRRWVLLKEFLYRSKSEGQNSKFRVSLSFSPIKDNKKKTTSQGNCGGLNNRKNNNSDGKEGKFSGEKDGAGKRKGLSAHEAHYAAKRAQAEEMRKKTYLPYRQGLLGCLGFRYRSYGAITGFARVFNPV
ncbi:hypothetical protein STAS_33091 [Striga asiatica]|uniref:Uncharacterized protein n=1 Tax=Striga asiatica TaxID=4170 RepID=A0A5A7RDM7_STRAF|nr:hypothetical protein STAS_33091 [Striga asiatica]